MSLLNHKREEIQKMVDDGMMRPESLKHYDLCKAMAQGMTQEQAAEKFNFTDDRYIRRIKRKKCPDCNKIH